MGYDTDPGRLERATEAPHRIKEICSGTLSHARIAEFAGKAGSMVVVVLREDRHSEHGSGRVISLTLGRCADEPTTQPRAKREKCHVKSAGS